MKAVIRKLSQKRGFTLAETLICVLILLMVTGIVGAAIPAASNAFTNAVDAANAQILLSTAKTVLRDELSTAAEISVNDSASKLVIQYRSNTNGWSQIVYTKFGADAGIVVNYREYNEVKNEFVYVKNRDLISGKAATKNLTLVLANPSLSSDKKILTLDLAVNRQKKSGSGVTELAGETGFTVRSVG